jgi:outer membrane protein assembly factor BamB
MRQALATTIVTAVWLAASFAAAAGGKNWSQFRGGNGDGVADAATLPQDWAPDKNVAWKARIAGIGWSQPVVWGDRIFLTTAVADKQPRPDPQEMGPGIGGLAGFIASGGGTKFVPPDAEYRRLVLCLDAATGDVLWEKTAREGRPTIHIHRNNTYATETPATDGERLIAHFGMTGLYCYDLAGNLLWSRDLDAYPTQFGWGTGSSPVLYGDFVYVQCDNDKQSFLLALDKQTGEEAWRVEREERSNWSTPYVWKNKLRTELVTAGGGRMRSYDPQTGAVLWEMNGHGRTASTPVGHDELLYVDSYDRLTGGNGALAAVRPGASGDISLEGAPSNEHVAWSKRMTGFRIASPVVCEGCLYVLEQGGGVVRCLDVKTGQEHYRKRLPGVSGFSASPVANGGHVYCLDQRGRTAIIAAGPELKVVATNDLGEMSWASPAVAANRLLLRTVDHLYAIGE